MHFCYRYWILKNHNIFSINGNSEDMVLRSFDSVINCYFMTIFLQSHKCWQMLMIIVLIGRLISWLELSMMLCGCMVLQSMRLWMLVETWGMDSMSHTPCGTDISVVCKQYIGQMQYYSYIQVGEGPFYGSFLFSTPAWHLPLSYIWQYLHTSVCLTLTCTVWVTCVKVLHAHVKHIGAMLHITGISAWRTCHEGCNEPYLRRLNIIEHSC